MGSDEQDEKVVTIWPMPTQFTQGIRFEVAQDVLGAVIAHWSEMAAQARDAANPDADHLAAIQAEHIDPAMMASLLESVGYE